MSYGGSANSPLGFLGNLWWQPEHTLIFPCKKISVKGFEGAGKTDDIGLAVACKGRVDI